MTVWFHQEVTETRARPQVLVPTSFLPVEGDLQIHLWEEAAFREAKAFLYVIQGLNKQWLYTWGRHCETLYRHKKNGAIVFALPATEVLFYHRFTMFMACPQTTPVIFMPVNTTAGPVSSMSQPVLTSGSHQP